MIFFFLNVLQDLINIFCEAVAIRLMLFDAISLGLAFIDFQHLA